MVKTFLYKQNEPQKTSLITEQLIKTRKKAPSVPPHASATHLKLEYAVKYKRPTDEKVSNLIYFLRIFSLQSLCIFKFHC